MTFGGTRLTPDNFLKTLARYKPGDRVQVTLRRNGQPRTAAITLAPPQIFDYRIEENPNASAQSKALRAAWLNGK